MPKVTTFLSHSKGPGRVAGAGWRAPHTVPGHGLGGGEVDDVHGTDTGPGQVDKLWGGSPRTRGKSGGLEPGTTWTDSATPEAKPAVTLANTQARKS